MKKRLNHSASIFSIANGYLVSQKPFLEKNIFFAVAVERKSQRAFVLVCFAVVLFGCFVVDVFGWRCLDARLFGFGGLVVFARLFVCLSFFVVCLSVCLFVCLSVCVCLFVFGFQ